MFSAFKQRRPWAAALISFVFDPFIGMLYLNRGWYAFLYFIAEIGIFVLAANHWGLTAPALLNAAVGWVISLLFRIVGAVHGIWIARSRNQDEPLHWYAHWYSVVAIYLALLAAPLLVKGFLYQSFYMPAGSMQPTLDVGDNIFVSKRAYDSAPPRRGDVIVFHVPHERGVSYVKRIVGIPGDRVQFTNGRLYLNGTAVGLGELRDPWHDCRTPGCPPIPQFVETIPGAPPHRILKAIDRGPFDNTGVVTVPANGYFVLGDNRDNSLDSRVETFGCIPRSAIIGKVAIKYFDGINKRWVWRKVE